MSPEEKRALLAELLRKKAGESTSFHPLSQGQIALWFVHQLSPESAAYNISIAARTRSKLNIPALRGAFQQLVNRHASLRTTFATRDGRPVQKVHGHMEVCFQETDASAWSEGNFMAHLVEEAHRPFDLEGGPLMRVSLFTRPGQETICLLSVHHIVFDATSLVVVLDELRALYIGELTGKKATLPPLSTQYADFVRWQTEMLAGPEGERLWEYWREQLAGELPVLNLPTDRPRPAVQTYRGSLYSFKLSETLTARIKKLAKAEGATLYMTLLAALQVLLHRYSGQDYILVGSPIVGRDRAEFEGIVGYFINPIVLRGNLSGNPSFREFLAQIRQTVLGALEHQTYPFPLLVERLHLVRDASRSPMFQVMFNMPKAYRLEAQGVSQFILGETGAQMDMGGAILEFFAIEQRVAMFDLLLLMVEAGGRLSASMQYNTDLFERASIARIAQHFQSLLESIVENTEQRLAELPMLTAAEQHCLLVEWNDTRAEFPSESCFQNLFEARVEQTPDAVAIFSESEQLTYGQLNRRANRLARSLVEQGVGPDVVVALLAERGLDLWTAILGVFKAGGAYLPLDPRHPLDRHLQVLEQSQTRVVLAAKEFLPKLSEALESIAIERRPQLIQIEELLKTDLLEANLPIRCAPYDLAYVIFTSGSTGVPKGAMIEHQGMLNHLFAKVTDLKISDADVIAQTASQCFDISVWQCLAALLVGGRVHIFSDDVVLDLARLLDQVERRGITILETVPSLLHAMLDEIGRRGQARPDLSALRWMIQTGEALSPDLCRQWLSYYPGVPLLNAYGPTECSDDVTHYAITQPPAPELIHVPIGRPIANTRLYILDKQLQPVPVGVAGELFVGGVGVGRGYLNDRQRTAEAFVPDRFAQEPDHRLYKTGDLVRYLPDGNIEFLGRIDHQVKIRGFRIELGEIETVLARHPAVREAVVLAREGARSERRLVAYVVPAGEAPLAIGELRAYLKEQLPDYMVPALFVFLDALPLTPNGKVDRQALPAPEDGGPRADTYVAPRNPTEELLAKILMEVLGLDRVGVYDNFFELGGDSILAIQAISRAAQGGLRYTPKQLLQCQTIAELATVVSTAPPGHAEQGPVTGPVPLTPIQCWFFEQDFPEPHHYNQALLLEVRQALDPSLLERAWAEVQAHHDALRLRFVRGEAGWRQEGASPNGAVAFSRVDLSAGSDTEQASAFESVVAEVQASLNLSQEPLLRIALFDFGSEKTDRLLIVIHHLVVDGVSWRILLEDLYTVYMQLRRGEAVALPPKTTSFKYWAERLAEYARSASLREELDYWLKLSETPVARLPVDCAESHSDNTEASASTVWSWLKPDETHDLLREVPQAYNTQINDVLLTALVQAFSEWTGSRTLLTDLEGHGREAIFEDVDISRTVGWFTTLFPVLLDLRCISEPGEALKTVKETLRCIPNQGIGYGLLRYLSGEPEATEKFHAPPQAEVSFNYLGQFDQVLQESFPLVPSTESTGPMRSPRGARRYVLDVTGGIADGRLRLAWTYSGNLHRRETIEALAERFMKALRALIAHCLSPDAGGYTPSDFPNVKLSQAKLDKVLAGIEEAVGD